jgi:hypothetical protein
MPALFAYLLADFIFLGWGNGPESNAGGLLFERRASVFPSTTEKNDKGSLEQFISAVRLC